MANDYYDFKTGTQDSTVNVDTGLYFGADSQTDTYPAPRTLSALADALAAHADTLTNKTINVIARPGGNITVPDGPGTLATVEDIIGDYILPDFTQAGTGAVTRTWQAKARERVTPEDFGAVGDGVADDGPAVAAALLYCEGGYELELRSGAVYKLTTWSTYTNSAAIRIKGNGGTLEGPSSAGVFMSPAADFFVNGVTFDGFSYVVSRTTGQSGSFTDCVFDHNTVLNNAGIAFYMERPWIGGSVSHNRFRDCTVAGCIRIGENTYANQDTWRDYSVCHNRIENLDGTSSNSTVGIIVYGLRGSVCHNHIKDLQAVTGEAWGIYTKLRFGVVEANIIENVQSTSHADVVGINLKGAGRGVTGSGVQGYSTQAIGNTIRNIGVAATKGIGIRVQIDDGSAHNNLIEDTGTRGITVDDTNGWEECSVIGNKIRFASTSVGTIGIEFVGTGRNGTAIGNNVRGCYFGFSINGGAGVTGLLWSGNQAESGTAGYALAFNSPVIDLLLIGNIARGSTYGVLDNGGTDATRCVIADTTAGSCGTPITAMPAGVTSRDNI